MHPSAKDVESSGIVRSYDKAKPRLLPSSRIAISHIYPHKQTAHTHTWRSSDAQRAPTHRHKSIEDFDSIYWLTTFNPNFVLLWGDQCAMLHSAHQPASLHFAGNNKVFLCYWICRWIDAQRLGRLSFGRQQMHAERYLIYHVMVPIWLFAQLVEQ